MKPDMNGIHGTVGRRRRFEALYQEYHGLVLGYVLRRTDSPDDAADVIAETFLTAWRRLDELPPEDQARLWRYGAPVSPALARPRQAGVRVRVRSGSDSGGTGALEFGWPGQRAGPAVRARREVPGGEGA
jgi:RNA polymerase sigma-70 factor (ECF subfamily)